MIFRLVLCGCLLSAPALFAQSPSAAFQRLDRNRDGQLTRDEVPDKRLFARIDKDQDGIITAAEDIAFMAARRKAPGNNVPDSWVAHRDLAYADNQNPRQCLDLYLPKVRPSQKPLPVVVYIHGGGWRNGRKDGGLRWVRPYVESGQYAGVSIGYRLSGEAKWPAQIHDCKAAIRWLKGNAKKYRLDPDKIGVIGTSAGGHLTAMLAVTGKGEELAGELGKHLQEESRIACAVDFYGPTEMLTMNDHPSRIDHDAEDSPESLLIGGAIQKHPQKAKHASPISYITADDRNLLIVHGEDDQLVPHPQSTAFYQALQKVGAAPLMITIQGGGHGGFNSRELDARVRRFFDLHLRGVEAKISEETIIRP